jgi:hypothetical protein
MEQPRIDIEYPGEGERVTSSQYTFRLGQDEELIEADISIDRGPWLPCRRACGFWWYDWTGYGAGTHQVAARGIARDGRTANSTLRRFEVAFKK